MNRRLKQLVSITALALLIPLQPSAQPQEEAKLLQLVQEFFDALQKQDTIAFRKMCLDEARNFAVREVEDSVVVRSHLSSSIRFNQKRILKERMRKSSTEIKVHGRIAMAWVPYDLWVNETFSHCGVDVFTFIHTDDGWKISSLSYTVETEGCE